MGVKKWSKKSFKDISQYKYLSCTHKYFDLLEQIKKNIPDKFLFVKDNFEILSGFAFKSTDYQEKGVKLCRIGDVSKSQLLLIENMEMLPEEFVDRYKEYLIKKNDVLIGLTGDGKIFKTCYVSELKEPILLNQRVGILRAINDSFSPKLLSYVMQSDFVQNQLRIVGMGKTQKNISPFDVLKVKIPNISFDNQQQILAIIAPFESEIASLKATKIPETDIINKVLGKELGLDWEKFEELKKIKQYKANISDFSKNVDSRMSYKFHNLAEKYLWDFMISKSDKRLKNFISEPIVLGESVSPEQYAEEGEFYYIAMSNIKFWNFETDDCRTVKKSYSDKAIKKGKIVKKDDIILARSGEGTIGKVALITDGVNAIFADFTQRIRLNNYNPHCAYYYFRSDIFQYFIYSHKKGMGNNTNIFPNQVQEFPMPDWSLEKQSKIATLIKEQIDAQKIIDEQILKKQQQILQIIENAVR